MIRIERITDMGEVLKCLPFEREIRKKGRDTGRESDLLTFIEGNIGSPLLGFFIVYDDDDNLIGYTVTMLSFVPGYKRLLLLRMYAKTKEVKKLFEDTIIEWMKMNKIKTGQITTSGHIKALQRWGWKVVSVNMERRI